MEDQNKNTGIHLTNKDLNKVFFRWWLTTELSNSYDRLQGLAFANALQPALKKLYAFHMRGGRKKIFITE